MENSFAQHIDLDEAYLKAWELSGKLKNGYSSNNWRVEDKFRLSWHNTFFEYLTQEDSVPFATKARLALLLVEDGIALASHPWGKLPKENDLGKKHIAKCNKFLKDLKPNLDNHQQRFLQACPTPSSKTFSP